MLEETRKALEGSIAKWEKIVAGTGTDQMTENCSLCERFEDCLSLDICPVVVATYEEDKYDNCSGCDESPYSPWIDHHRKEHTEEYAQSEMKVSCPECQKLAQAELDFLRSLMLEE